MELKLWRKGNHDLFQSFSTQDPSKKHWKHFEETFKSQRGFHENQKVSNATSQKLLKWSRNSEQLVAANFSRIQQSEEHPRSFQNKSENQKCVQTTSNKNQQTRTNIWNVTETLPNKWPPMCPEFRHPKNPNAPLECFKNTFDIQEFFHGTSKKLPEIF